MQDHMFVSFNTFILSLFAIMTSIPGDGGGVDESYLHRVRQYVQPDRGSNSELSE
jgi:hypothetical protein